MVVTLAGRLFIDEYVSIFLRIIYCGCNSREKLFCEPADEKVRYIVSSSINGRPARSSDYSEWIGVKYHIIICRCKYLQVRVTDPNE